MGRALMMHLWLAHGKPLDDISTLDDLRALSDKVLDTTDDAAPTLARIGQPLEIYAWNRFSTAPPPAVRPDSVAEEDPGRWIRQVLGIYAGCDTRRYIAHLEYCDPTLQLPDLWNRCRGKTPAVFVMPGEDDPEEASQTKAEYRQWMTFRVMVIVANWRGGVAARFTPPSAEDTSSIPGLEVIVGDIKNYCAANPTLEHTRGLLTIALGRSRPEGARGVAGNERIVARSVDLRMRVNVTVPNVPCELLTPSAIWAQLQDDLGRAVGDPNQIRLS